MATELFSSQVIYTCSISPCSGFYELKIRLSLHTHAVTEWKCSLYEYSNRTSCMSCILTSQPRNKTSNPGHPLQKSWARDRNTHTGDLEYPTAIPSALPSRARPPHFHLLLSLLLRQFFPWDFSISSCMRTCARPDTIGVDILYPAGHTPTCVGK